MTQATVTPAGSAASAAPPPRATSAPSVSTSGPSRKPEWAPRIWQGCDFFAWVKLLVRNRFAVEWRYVHIAIVITFVSLGHTFLRVLQDAFYRRILRRTELKSPPIFILGHWRTGTTLLHELIICDERLGYPTTYQCLAPNNFLLTESLFTRCLQFLLPTHRPMDNMKIGFDRPQEEEFAMCMLGEGSPYLTIAFPNHPPQCQEYLDLENISSAKLRRWKRTFKHFLQRVTYQAGKRLVLKSPPHTARIKVLREIFPGAAFIHIVRDPYVVYASTVNLWRTLYKTHGLQTPTFDGLEEQVLQTFVKLYERLEEGKKLLGPQQFYELRYEDLIENPALEMKKIYDHFGFGGFEAFLPRLQEYLASIKNYETNKYQLSDRERAEITKRWAEVIERYGYSA